MCFFFPPQTTFIPSLFLLPLELYGSVMHNVVSLNTKAFPSPPSGICLCIQKYSTILTINYKISQLWLELFAHPGRLPINFDV